MRTPFLPQNRNHREQDWPEILNDEDFKAAIALSSPYLYDQLNKLLANDVTPKEKHALETTFYKYFKRMTYRCTPFGMFAGISFGFFDSRTSCMLDKKSKYERYARIDTFWLRKLAQKIESQSEIRNHLKWFPNNTIYSLGDKIFYTEPRLEGENLSHQLSAISNSDYARFVLNVAANGLTIPQIIAELLQQDVDLPEAKEFLDEIISAKLLLSELEPVTTSENYLDRIHYFLSCQNSERAITLGNIITEIKFSLNKIQSNETKAIFKYLSAIANLFQHLGIYTDKSSIVQVDLFKPSTISLGSSIIEDIKKAINLLAAISDHENARLKEFKEKFIDRYDQQEVPLTHALDPNSGIGYPVNSDVVMENNSLLQDLKYGLSPDHEIYTLTDWNKFLLAKYFDVINKGRSVLEISSAEALKFTTIGITKLLPSSFYTLCCIISSKTSEDFRESVTVCHESTEGASGMNLMTRFCHVNPELSNLICDSIKNEAKSCNNVIIAEIAHVATPRLANISLRPSFRTAEIPILTAPSKDVDHVIELADIMVSVQNHVILRSKKLNKRILPRLTTAHNFNKNPIPAYRFLCDVQHDGRIQSLSWDWGPLNDLPFLPQVSFSNVILAKARWNINANEFLMEIKDFLNYKKNMKISDLVTLSEGDNQLPLDLRNETDILLLFAQLQKSKRVTLIENIFDKQSLLVTGPEGSFTNEIIIPWQTVSTQNEIISVSSGPLWNNNYRKFSPGSNWHYLKIYCGIATSDELLCRVVLPITQQLVTAGIIEKWFFVRYADPDYHIRIRFLGQHSFHVCLMDKMHESLEPFLKSGLVWRIQMDTYCRELERYGVANIDNSETLFFHDSMASCQIISHLEGHERDDLRWQFAIKGVNDLLDCFGYNLSNKKNLMDILSTNFRAEFNGDSTESKQLLSSKFRDFRSKIEWLTRDQLDQSNEYHEVWQTFENRKQNLTSCVKVIDHLYSTNQLAVQKSDLVASYIHMFLNRFLRSKQRMQEMVIYDMLYQHYRSTLARSGKSDRA